MILLAAALAVAAVSGAFSIVGLAAIFTGAFWPVVGMGAALGCAKLSAVAWLGRRHAASRWLKGAIVTLVVALMGLNVVGAYGFLAKAHIDHAVANEAQVASHEAEVSARREVAAAELADVDKRLRQIDAGVDETIRRGRTAAALTLAEHQSGRRGDLVEQRTRAAGALASIAVDDAGVQNERTQQTADYGPLMYLAKLMGADQDTVLKWFIVVVACLLDPAALLLLLAASARQ